MATRRAGTTQVSLDRVLGADQGRVREERAGLDLVVDPGQILEDRAPLYARADATIDTTDKTSEEALAMLVRLIHEYNGAGTNGTPIAAAA